MKDRLTLPTGGRGPSRKSDYLALAALALTAGLAAVGAPLLVHGIPEPAFEPEAGLFPLRDAPASLKRAGGTERPDLLSLVGAIDAPRAPSAAQLFFRRGPSIAHPVAMRPGFMPPFGEPLGGEQLTPAAAAPAAGALLKSLAPLSGSGSGGGSASSASPAAAAARRDGASRAAVPLRAETGPTAAERLRAFLKNLPKMLGSGASALREFAAAITPFSSGATTAAGGEWVSGGAPLEAGAGPHLSEILDGPAEGQGAAPAPAKGGGGAGASGAGVGAPASGGEAGALEKALRVFHDSSLQPGLDALAAAARLEQAELRAARSALAHASPLPGMSVPAWAGAAAAVEAQGARAAHAEDCLAQSDLSAFAACGGPALEEALVGGVRELDARISGLSRATGSTGVQPAERERLAQAVLSAREHVAAALGAFRPGDGAEGLSAAALARAAVDGLAVRLAAAGLGTEAEREKRQAALKSASADLDLAAKAWAQAALGGTPGAATAYALEAVRLGADAELRLREVLEALR